MHVGMQIICETGYALHTASGVVTWQPWTVPQSFLPCVNAPCQIYVALLGPSRREYW